MSKLQCSYLVKSGGVLALALKTTVPKHEIKEIRNRLLHYFVVAKLHSSLVRIIIIWGFCLSFFKLHELIGECYSAVDQHNPNSDLPCPYVWPLNI